MKFLCDRCKTRYSIADERVRGKILKIRCKNCSAVISVREGMDEGAGSEWSAPPPAAATSVPAPVPSAPVRPPPASLHEEWYVSLDGAQEGPFLLPEAQAWVAAKAADDELHCWCEGFDDWLPVEKVSHFRGLRAKVTRARAPEPEPKPLFAATLAAMEADAEKEKAEKAEKAAAAKAAAEKAAAEKAAAEKAAADKAAAEKKAAAAAAPPLPGTAAKPGTGNLPRLSPTALKSASPAAGQAKVNAPPLPKAATPAAAAAPPLPAAPRVGAGLPPMQALSGPGGAPLPAASSSVVIPRQAPMFDTGPVEDDGANGSSASAASAMAPPAAEPDDEATRRDPVDDIDDDLSIGEVSRVVRLADVAKAMPAARKAPAPAAAAAAAQRNATAAAAIARGTGMVARVDPADAGADVAPGAEGAPSMYQALVAQPPRRRTLLYVGIAVVALALIAIVVLVATSGSGDDDDQIAGGTTRKYDDLGGTVDNPLVPRAGSAQDKRVDAGVGPGSSTGTGRRPTGSGGRPTGSGSNSGSQTSSGTGTGQVSSQIGPDGQPLRPLTADDVFAMSSRMEIGTRRCYERALKDDPFLKVTKIKATITVKNTGTVSDVNLSSMQGTPLASCLSAAIGRWRFRPSTDGIVSEFALVFEQR